MPSHEPMCFARPHGARALFRSRALALLAAASFPIAALTPSAAAQPEVWNVGGLSPAPRCEHSLVWDSSGQRLVLFGGMLLRPSDSLLGNDTWALVGDVWRFLPNHGSAVPEPRLDHAAAYDSARRRMVVYGGSLSETEVSGETWEWNGASWTRLAAPGPGPRFAHAMTFDSRRGACVLFGGRSPAGSNLGDTWEWNGDNWELRAKTGPSPRRFHAMAFDSRRGVTVLHGGRPVLGDTWEWDGISWRLATAQSGVPREGHSLAFDAERGVCVLFGGDGPMFSPSTWEWNGLSWQSVPDATILRPTMLPAAFDAARRRVVAVGGARANAASNSLLRHTLARADANWDLVGAGAEHFNSVIYDPRQRAVLSLATNPRLNSDASVTQAWDGFAWRALPIKSPPRRIEAGLVLDSCRVRVVASGGRSSFSASSSLNDTWEWDGTRWHFRLASPLAARAAHAMAFDAHRCVAVAFGGTTGGTSSLNDTIEYDGSTWHSVPAPGPSARVHAGIVFDPVRRVCVLYGGRSTSAAAPLTDTWNWDGSHWALSSTVGPLLPSPQLSFDSVRGNVVLVGGAESGQPIRVWDWTGTTWANRPVPTPTLPPFANMTTSRSPAPLAGVAYDSARSRLVAVHTTGVVYELGPATLPPAILAQPEPVSIPQRRTATFAVEVAGTDPVRLLWRRNGVNLADGPTGHGSAIIGSRDKSLTIASIGPEDEGDYQCLVQNLAGDVFTTAVTLDVLCYADCDGTSHPPILGATDYICFMNKFAAGDPYANCDDSTNPPVLNVADFVCFLSRLAAGCP